MSNIGKNIKHARMEKNMRQEDLASKLYVTRATISNYETNRSNPDIETLQQIAEVLDTDVNTLIYGERKEQVNRKPVYVMLAILIIALILLVPVSCLIEKAVKEYQTYNLRTPVPYLIWAIHIKGILKIVSISTILYLFLYSLRIRLPYPKAREIISCLLIIGYLAYMINTLVSFNTGTIPMFWFVLYRKSQLLPVLFDGIYGIVFGICSYRTLFFQDANDYHSLIRTFMKDHKRITVCLAALIIASMMITNKATEKDFVIYGTVNQNSTEFISMDVDSRKTDAEAIEEVSASDGTYGIDVKDIRNTDELPGLFTEGMEVKIVIRRNIFQLNGDRYYVYIPDNNDF